MPPSPHNRSSGRFERSLRVRGLTPQSRLLGRRLHFASLLTVLGGSPDRRSGWEVVDFYEDAGISGSNGREKRPGLDRLLKDATARRINMIAAWSVDRLGRSLQHLVELLNELQALQRKSLHTKAVFEGSGHLNRRKSLGFQD